MDISFPNTIWDGRTGHRRTLLIDRSPDNVDWERIVEELIATQVVVASLGNAQALAPSATIDTTNASNITSGTLSSNRLPTTNLIIRQYSSPIVTTTPNIDLSLSNLFKLTINNNTTLSVTNATIGQQFTLRLESNNSYIITWFPNITWFGQVPATVNGIMYVTFRCIDIDTYDGWYLGQV